MNEVLDDWKRKLMSLEDWKLPFPGWFEENELLGEW